MVSMVISKVVVASILSCLLLLLLHQVQSQGTSNGGGLERSNLPIRINCKVACASRCQLSKRPNLCQRICGTCCFRCNCVPPGTYGNFAACPCYASLTTRNNRRKCP